MTKNHEIDTDPFSSFKLFLSIIFEMNIVNDEFVHMSIHEGQILEFLTYSSTGICLTN